jgi:gluconokinase
MVMIVVLMGVSGVGKTTVGERLAGELGWTFVEADEFHPPDNVEKMRGGTPLTDDDRRPWLRALRGRIGEACGRGENIVLACSALKADYREYLEKGCPTNVRYVYLRGSAELVRRRLEGRKGHFMNPVLLESQFETLEPPEGDIQVDAAPPPEEIAAEIRRRLGL